MATLDGPATSGSWYFLGVSSSACSGRGSSTLVSSLLAPWWHHTLLLCQLPACLTEQMGGRHKPPALLLPTPAHQPGVGLTTRGSLNPFRVTPSLGHQATCQATVGSQSPWLFLGSVGGWGSPHCNNHPTSHSSAPQLCSSLTPPQPITMPCSMWTVMTRTSIDT